MIQPLFYFDRVALVLVVEYKKKVPNCLSLWHNHQILLLLFLEIPVRRMAHQTVQRRSLQLLI